MAYSDTAHFSLKEYRRSDYFRRIKEVWTVMKKRSKMRLTKNIFKILRRDISLYEHLPLIIL